MYVDASITRGLSNVAIAAGFAEAGGKLDKDVVGRHKSGHYIKPIDPDAPTPTNRDLAIIMRDKVVEAIEPMSGEALLLFGKDMAPMVSQGLKAQALVDKREQVNKKLGIAAGALSLQMWLAGLSETAPPPELDDGNTIEGKAVEVG